MNVQRHLTLFEIAIAIWFLVLFLMLGYRYQFMATFYLEQAFKNGISLAF